MIRFLFKPDIRLIGILTALVTLLVLALLFLLVNTEMIAKDSLVVQVTMPFIVFSPLIAVLLTTIRLRTSHALASFGQWVKYCFFNYILSALILCVAGLLISKQPNILHQLFVDRFYIILFIALFGLAISVLTPVLFKK